MWKRVVADAPDAELAMGFLDLDHLCRGLPRIDHILYTRNLHADTVGQES